MLSNTCFTFGSCLVRVSSRQGLCPNMSGSTKLPSIILLITCLASTTHLVTSQCTRVSTGTGPRPPNIPDGAPTWFAECEGFGCRVTEEYQHTKCCVENMLESELIACTQSKDMHVIFGGSGRIVLTQAIKAKENLILDGTWHDVVIAGERIEMKKRSIVRRIAFESSSREALYLYRHDSFTWIHKSTFGTSTGKMITIGRGFTGITISNSKFYDSSGSSVVYPIQVSLRVSDQRYDQYMQLSMKGNYFSSYQSQSPYIRFGYIHIYNNVMEDWTDYGIACSYNSRCYVEGNWFSSSTSPSRNIIDIVAGTDSRVGYVRMTDNYVGSGGQNLTNGDLVVATPPYDYTPLTSASHTAAELYTAIVKAAGAGFDLSTI